MDNSELTSTDAKSSSLKAFRESDSYKDFIFVCKYLPLLIIGVGLFYLHSYLKLYGIPLSVYTSIIFNILLMAGGFHIFFVSILVMYISIPSLISASGIFGSSSSYIYRGVGRGVSGYGRITLNVVFLWAIPCVYLIFVGIVLQESHTAKKLIVYFLGAFLWFYLQLILSREHYRSRSFFDKSLQLEKIKIALLYLFLSLPVIVSYSIFITFITIFDLIDGPASLLALSSIYIIFNVILLFPSRSYMVQNGSPGRRMFILKAFVVAIMFLSTMTPSVSKNIGKASLIFFGLGGGEKVRVILPESNINYFYKGSIDCSEGFCKSKVMEKILSSDKFTYFFWEGTVTKVDANRFSEVVDGGDCVACTP
jgi:hypothetical protein